MKCSPHLVNQPGYLTREEEQSESTEDSSCIKSDMSWMIKHYIYHDTSPVMKGSQSYDRSKQELSADTAVKR